MIIGGPPLNPPNVSARLARSPASLPFPRCLGNVAASGRAPGFRRTPHRGQAVLRGRPSRHRRCLRRDAGVRARSRKSLWSRGTDAVWIPIRRANPDWGGSSTSSVGGGEGEEGAILSERPVSSGPSGGDSSRSETNAVGFVRQRIDAKARESLAAGTCQWDEGRHPNVSRSGGLSPDFPHLSYFSASSIRSTFPSELFGAIGLTES